MTQITSYTEWREQQSHYYHNVNPHALGGCPDCNASGEVECSECGHESACERCESAGQIKISEGGKPDLSFHKYFNQVSRDLLDICGWTGKSYLDEMANFISANGRIVNRRY